MAHTLAQAEQMLKKAVKCDRPVATLKYERVERGAVI